MRRDSVASSLGLRLWLDAVLAPRRTNVFTRSATKFLNRLVAKSRKR